jgi:predicted nucleotidyltransferase
MDKADVIEIPQRFANVLRANYGPIRVILFVSYAKGDFKEDSDIDIAVVFGDFCNRIDMQLELMRIRRKIDSRIEARPFRTRDFSPSNPFVDEILRYGKEIEVK